MERQVISGFGLFLFPVGHITIPLGKELDILFAHVSKLKRLSSCIRGPDWNGGPKKLLNRGRQAGQTRRLRSFWSKTYPYEYDPEDQ